MGFLARGFIRLHQASGDAIWRDKAEMCLQWLIGNRSPGYSGACWGNHFDYQSRSSYVTKDIPSVVWTSLIGHAFLDAYDHFHREQFLGIAVSACEHIERDLGAYRDGETHCIHYFPTSKHPGTQCQLARLARACLPARTCIRETSLFESSPRKPCITPRNIKGLMRPGIMGKKAILHWVDNFHTAYVLDCFKYYGESTGDSQFDRKLMDGYYYWKNTFFLPDGTPRYYNHKTLPLDIQCCSQAIDTLVFFHDRDKDSLPLAIKIAEFTIRHMQDRSGYFYYRRYSPWVVNKTPTLHWGQATMLCALAGLYKLL